MCSTKDAVSSYRSLREAGLSRSRIEARLTSGELERSRRGVYVSRGACGPVRTAAAHGGALACVSAARHLGLWVLDTSSEVHVWMSGHGRRHHTEACDCIEHWDLAPRQGPFAPPTVARVLKQLLRCRGVEEFFVTLESALAQRAIDSDGLRWLHLHAGEAAREAMKLARSDAESGLESLLRWRLRAHGLRVHSGRNRSGHAGSWHSGSACRPRSLPRCGDGAISREG